MLALALLVVSGCAGRVQRPTAYHVSIASSFSPNAVEGIIAGFDSWKSAAGVTGDVVIADCTSTVETDLCVKEDLSMEGLKEGQTYGPNITIYSNSLVEYAVTNKLDIRDMFQRVGAHEIGHAFGLGHSAAGNVMSPTLEDVALTPTPADVEAFWNAS